MVNDLRAAFFDLLAENDWMDEETRQSAARKAEAMLVLLGFPTSCDSSAQLDEFYSKVFRIKVPKGSENVTVPLLVLAVPKWGP
jgi:predicted metalloendopeptidase